MLIIYSCGFFKKQNASNYSILQTNRIVYRAKNISRSHRLYHSYGSKFLRIIFSSTLKLEAHQKFIKQGES